VARGSTQTGYAAADLRGLVCFNAEYVLRAGLGANAARNTLAGRGGILGMDHNLERTRFDTLAAVGTLGLVNRVHTGLVLRNRAGFARLGTLSALDTDRDFKFAVFSRNANTRQIFFKRAFIFVKRQRARIFARKAVHTRIKIIHRKFFHTEFLQNAKQA
jgi:hypothetical protein